MSTVKDANTQPVNGGGNESIGDVLQWLATPGTGLAVASGLGGLAGGALLGTRAAMETDRPGETPGERRARLLRNVGAGVLGGGLGTGGLLYGTNMLLHPTERGKVSQWADKALGKFQEPAVGATTGAGLGFLTKLMRGGGTRGGYLGATGLGATLGVAIPNALPFAIDQMESYTPDGTISPTTTGAVTAALSYPYLAMRSARGNIGGKGKWLLGLLPFLTAGGKATYDATK